MLFWVLAVTVPIYAVALYLSYHSTAQRLEEGAARDADELAARLAAGIDTVIRPIEGGIRTVALQLEEVNPPPEQYAARIHGILNAWSEVYGSTIATEVRGADGRSFAPYYFRRAGALAYSDLALASYGYSRLPWYRRAADSRAPVWSAPYFDKGGGETWMVTYSVPFFHRTASGERQLAGVVTADLALDWVRGAAARVRLPPFTAGWLASEPSPQDFVAPIGSVAGPGVNSIRTAAEKMLSAGRTFGLVRPDPGSQSVYLAVRTLQTLGWRLMLVMERSQLLAQANEVLRRQLALGAAGLLLLVTAISFVATGVSRPIHRLAAAVGEARDGDLEFPLPDESGRDETSVLTNALRRLRDSLKTHVQLRAESLAAQSRLEHELQIAASIQQSMLPRHDAHRLPADLRVAATLIPARRVGGDLYDFFLLGDGRLLFVIGDVSDKGIPAALFMARVSGLIRVLGRAGALPEKILGELNTALADANDACMFVTLGCGTLDPQGGLLRYASAGHDAPLLLRANGDLETLATCNGPAIGIETSAEYLATEDRLAPGDMLVLFTDGLSEAASEDGNQLGVERLGKLLQQRSGDAPAELVQRVADAIAGDGARFHAEDDLTVLAISRTPTTFEQRFEPDLAADGVARTQRWLREILAGQGIDSVRAGEAELVAEELLTNIARAAAPAAVRASVQCRLTPTDIVLVFRDDGPAFDPLARAAPAFEVDITERAVGGLGIHLVRELARQVHYTRAGDENVLEVRLHRSREAA